MSRALLFTLALVCATSVSQAQVHTPYDFATGINGPRFMTQLSDGTVLVAEFFGSRVSAYPPGGGNASRTDFATGLGGPASVTQLADGTVLVAEWNAGRVSAFPASGGNANRTDFATGLANPYGVTQLADGTVLVAEYAVNRVSAFAASGGNATRTDFATGLGSPTGVTQLSDGTVLVSERNSNRVSAFPASGGNANRTDFATGVSLPYGVAQVADGTVLVAEYGAGRVSAFPASGGASNRSDFATGLFHPLIAVQLDDGTVLVVEVGNNRVLAFGLSRRTFTDGLTRTSGVTQLADGRVLIADYGSGGIREVATDGTESSFATVPGGPQDFAELPNGDILISLFDSGIIAAFDAGGTRLTPDYATGLSNPTGFGVLPDGRVVVAERTGGRVTVVADASGGRVTPSTYFSGLSGPHDLVRLDDGRMVVTEAFANRVSVISDAAGTPLPGPSPLVQTLNFPNGIAQLGDGRILVAEYNDSEVTTFQPDGSGRIQFAGSLPRPTFVTQLADGRVLVGQDVVSNPGTGQVTEFGGLPALPATLTLTLTDGEGYRMLALPTGGPYDDLLGPIWTQGFTGADNSDGACSALLFDEAAGDFGAAYTCVGDQMAPFVRGLGAYVYVYEDDDFGASGVQGGFPKTLTVTGEAAAPFSAFPLTYTTDGADPDEEGWNLLGNPLRHGFDWDDAVRSGGLTSSIYVYDPNYLGGDYRTWTASIGGTLTDGVVPAFQAFFAKASGAGPGLTVPQAAVVEPGPDVYGRPASAVRGEDEGPLRLELAQETAEGDVPVSVAFVAPTAGAALGLDPQDAYRLTPTAWPRTVLSTFTVGDSASTPLALNALPADARGEIEVPMEVTAGGHPSGPLALAISWTGALPEGWAAVLLDRETGAEVDLGAAGSYRFALDVPELSATNRGPLARTGLNLAPPSLRVQERQAQTASASSGGRFALRLVPPAVSAFALSLVPENGPVTLPESGGRVRFVASGSNPTGAALTQAAWLEVTDPVGGTTLRTLGTVTLGPGESASKRMGLRLGASAPAGTYTVVLYAGNESGPALSSASFTFEKAGAASQAAGSQAAASRVAGSGGVVIEADEAWTTGPAPEASGAPGTSLGLPSPNPSRGAVRIPYALAEAGPARLAVFDALGREVAALVDGSQPEGEHEASLDASALVPGVYIVRLVQGGRTESRRLTVVR